MNRYVFVGHSPNFWFGLIATPSRAFVRSTTMGDFLSVRVGIKNT